jgi:hypothetical protein
MSVREDTSGIWLEINYAFNFQLCEWQNGNFPEHPWPISEQTQTQILSVISEFPVAPRFVSRSNNLISKLNSAQGKLYLTETVTRYLYHSTVIFEQLLNILQKWLLCLDIPQQQQTNKQTNSVAMARE